MPGKNTLITLLVIGMIILITALALYFAYGKKKDKEAGCIDIPIDCAGWWLFGMTAMGTVGVMLIMYSAGSLSADGT